MYKVPCESIQSNILHFVFDLFSLYKQIFANSTSRIMTKYSFAKYSFSKYSFAKCSFAKYSFAKYSFAKFRFAKYSKPFTNTNPIDPIPNTNPDPTPNLFLNQS